MELLTTVLSETVDGRRAFVAQCALENVGNAYRREAQPAEVPHVFNCSLLVWHAYRQIGIDLPQRSLEQAHCGDVVDFCGDSDVLPADLLFFQGFYSHADGLFPKGIGHVVIALGDGQVVHATSARGSPFGMSGVQTAPLRLMLGRTDLVVIKRILR